MIIVDKTGRKLKIGQMLDVMLVGMMKGKLVDIKDSVIQLSPTQIIYPHLVVSMVVTPNIQQNGFVDAVYIVADADPKELKEVEAAQKSRFEM